MAARAKIFRFENEAAMCAAFIKDAGRQGWDAYPETGFDIVLVHRESKLQIGVEAKQTLNAKVIVQATDGLRWGTQGPDYRAVLVPDGGADGLSALAIRLGVTVIRANGEPDERGMTTTRCKTGGTVSRKAFWPWLPSPQLHPSKWPDDWYQERTEQNWVQHFPEQQIKLPDYVPDVAAGASAPVALTEWKVRAIKIAVILERRGFVVRGDFKALGISMSRWTQSRWIERRGSTWVRGSMPDFRAQHPVNFDQISADFDRWSKDLPATLPMELPL